MKILAALALILCLTAAGCGYCPPYSRSEMRQAREDFHRAGWQAREELRRARQDAQRELRQAREDFRREMREARRDFHDQFSRW